VILRMDRQSKRASKESGRRKGQGDPARQRRSESTFDKERCERMDQFHTVTSKYLAAADFELSPSL
jgi:hypothetical protein